MSGVQPKAWPGENLPTTGAAVIEINGQRVWIYSGSRIVQMAESIMLHPPLQWQPGRPRYPQEFYSDGRAPKTHDTMPGSR